ncbi:hypothetical protein HV819_10265 [Anaerococcus sp. AGMB00486]|uniref:DUF975 family protein n=2 Tax=Anaerococcus TaxID=165779 RepID=A0ABX2NCK0_9FIRM|nr:MULTISPECIES: hypothetical protein [Anaerococcus]MDY3006522.1 hypothetical protein [Anaerococcus porci]MSS77907.1 hypothetical protein [Anaerococcus porci]NVF12340.1 hypothetical protein [Anaerococcus faecalis]
MKREYSYGSVFIVNMIFAILSGLASYVIMTLLNLNESNFLVGFIRGIITLFSSFLITAGLINNRTGGVGDYLNQVSRINGKVIIINLLVLLISTAITYLLGTGAILSVISKNPLSLLSATSVGYLATIVFDLLTTYTNHILVDPRNKNQPISESIKDIFSTSIKLLGKTITVYLLYILIPVAILAGLLTILFLATDDPMTTLGIGVIVGGLFFIYFLIIGPIIRARIADNYLDYKGDLKREDDIFTEERYDNNHTITRNV